MERNRILPEFSELKYSEFAIIGSLLQGDCPFFPEDIQQESCAVSNILHVRNNSATDLTKMTQKSYGE